MIRSTIYLMPVEVQASDLENLGQIRSQRGDNFLARSILLARRGPQGILLWSRTSQGSYYLSWETVRAMLQEEDNAKCAIIGMEEDAS